MKMNRLLKAVPLVLAFMLLVPIGAMASTYQFGDQNNNDYSTLSGSSIVWTNFIDTYHYPPYPTIVHNSYVSWYNEYHNANGGNPVSVGIVAHNQAGGNDNTALGNLGPYSYTSNFLYTTNNAKTIVGNEQELLVEHVYNGNYVTNNVQVYNGV